MKNQGSWVVIVIFLAAASAALFAWNFRMKQSQRVLDLYGGQNAALIRGSQAVYWIDFVPAVPTPNSGDLHPGRVPNGELTPELSKFSKPVDITRQSGLIHARAALISDVSYDWDKSTTDANWQFGLKFKSSESECTLLFDLVSRQCLCLNNGRQVTIGEKLVSGLQAFADDVQRQNGVTTGPTHGSVRFRVKKTHLVRSEENKLHRPQLTGKRFSVVVPS